MEKSNSISDAAAFDGAKLWDEILKAIVAAMPTQLFPLFKEVYGREYSKDTPIVVLGTETSSFQEDEEKPPTSTLMDIALLVAGSDYYHLECQMKNDNEMVIRMFAYDVRFAIIHTKEVDKDTGEVTLYFPRSVVIYPEKNDALPDDLKCRVVFQDNSEHIYKIPTVKIQTYSLQEIKEKHLTLFIPYTILRLRPKLASNRKQPLTRKELTEFVEEVILVLKEEYSDGYLTEREYYDYMRLFHHAMDRVLYQYPQMKEEVKQMTEPLIKLPSMIVGELEAEIAKQKAEIADQKAEIRRLQELVVQLSSENNTP
ncbi:MAG: hypothetical protein J1F41_10995 [Lachnospiraceae bacterium]|nr:hypothetical protein [Lachnospiraceae bacterium]